MKEKCIARTVSTFTPTKAANLAGVYGDDCFRKVTRKCAKYPIAPTRMNESMLATDGDTAIEVRKKNNDRSRLTRTIPTSANTINCFTFSIGSFLGESGGMTTRRRQALFSKQYSNLET
jgi:hypothetical protein